MVFNRYNGKKSLNSGGTYEEINEEEIHWQSLSHLLPHKFLKELQRFKRNNSLAMSYSINGNLQLHCCRQCLKAHALKIARELNVNRSVMIYLETLFPGEAGHQGYYINQENLYSV